MVGGDNNNNNNASTFAFSSNHTNTNGGVNTSPLRSATSSTTIPQMNNSGSFASSSQWQGFAAASNGEVASGQPFACAFSTGSRASASGQANAFHGGGFAQVSGQQYPQGMSASNHTNASQLNGVFSQKSFAKRARTDSTAKPSIAKASLPSPNATFKSGGTPRRPKSARQSIAAALMRSQIKRAKQSGTPQTGSARQASNGSCGLLQR